MLEAHNLWFCKESLFKSWTSSIAIAYMYLFKNQAMGDTASTTQHTEDTDLHEY